jgi:hypothetical protein
MAREAKGLTPGQLAERTHMIVQTVEGLEREDFSRIVAPIYGRGFVKLYCEAVGLEPKPFVDAFMELYSGGTGAKPPPSAPGPAKPPPPSAPVEPVAAEPPPKVQATIDFDAPAKPPAPADQASARQPRQPASRYAAPMPIDDGPSLPAVNWRMVALAATAVTIVALAVFGVRALYRVTMTAPEDVRPDEAEPTPAPAEAQTPAKAAADRKPLPLKPFYIDSNHTTETEKENK